jgi:phosphoribosyl-dephospho-CoA transferase
MFELLPRHTMVTPRPRAWRALLAARPELAHERLVAGWADAGYPLVARRPGHSDTAGTVPLGLPLPPAHGKRRIAVCLMPRDIARSSPPPLLRDAAAATPAFWHAAIDALLQVDPLTRCFGSLAWQYLTGLAYVSDASDLDLLWDLPAVEGIDRFLESITAISRAAPMRIDGEVLGAAGGVNWRELWRGGEMLVKDRAEVHLMTRAEFLAGGRS